MSDDLLDEFLSEFDFGGTDPLAPLTSEEFVLQRLTEGKNPRVQIVRYNLIQQFKFRDGLRRRGITFRRDVFSVSHDGNISKELSDLEFAKAVNEDYVNATCAETLKFAVADGRGKVDMAKLMDMLADYEPIKDVINNTHGLR